VEQVRDTIIFVGIGLLIGIGWYHFYVKPHDEFNELVSSCMISKNDMSVQSYHDCVDEMRPIQ